jgi:hypothetical protein
MTGPDEQADRLGASAPDSELSAADQEVLSRIRLTLEDDASWGEPPASQRSSVLAQVAREQTARAQATRDLTAHGPTAHGPTARERMIGGAVPERSGESPRPRRSHRSRPAWWLWAATAAAATALVAFLAWPRPATTTFAMAGTSLAPAARATAEFEPRSAGVAIRLEIKGLAAASAGTYYSAWLRGPGGIVPVGSFHWRTGGIPIDLWSGVGSDTYPELFVTLQHEGRSPQPSTEVVLSGQVSAAH